VDDPETVTIEVTDPSDSGIVYTENVTDAEDDTVYIDVTEPDGVRGTDLRSSTVTVTVDQVGENATAVELENGTSVPLHSVQLASDRPAWIDSDGEGDNATDTLYVPLDDTGTAGFPEAEEVDVDLDIDGSGTPNVTGTARENGPNSPSTAAN